MYRATLAAVFVAAFAALPCLPANADPQADAPPATGAAVAELVPFDEMILTFSKENHIDGAAVAITKDGQLIYARGFGWADPDAMEKVLPTSLFRIASISKPITAVAIMMLIERGKLKLDDKAFDFLSG